MHLNPEYQKNQVVIYIFQVDFAEEYLLWDFVLVCFPVLILGFFILMLFVSSGSLRSKILRPTQPKY
jgi:hypothetical protein